LHDPACQRQTFLNPVYRSGGTTDARTPPRTEICRQPRRMALPVHGSGTPLAAGTVRPSYLGVCRGALAPLLGGAGGKARPHLTHRAGDTALGQSPGPGAGGQSPPASSPTVQVVRAWGCAPGRVRGAKPARILT